MTNHRANRRQIFSRPTIIVACHLLQDKGHSGLNRLMLEFGLEDFNTAGNLEDRANLLARFALQMTDHLVESVEGSVSLHEAIVRAAVSVSPRARHADDWTKFHRGLERDGFSLEKDQETGRFEIRRMHPDVVDLVEAEDEVIALLKRHSFIDAQGHLKQALDNHTRGQWAAANSQIRSFLESIFDEIGKCLAPAEIEGCSTGHGRRAVLANLSEPFLSKELFEWSDDAKHAFIPGLFKRLNPQGSHPGLSEDEDSTFRLHVVLITARSMLRRFADRISPS